MYDGCSTQVVARLLIEHPVCKFCVCVQDDMQCAEDYVRFCCKYLLEHCMPDLNFINKMIDSTAIARLQQVREPGKVQERERG
jgi:asparaginyl-tRNA synthetase